MELKDVKYRHLFYEFINDKKYKTALEIGVREGLNSVNMLKSNIDILYCIDPWMTTKVRDMTRNDNGDQKIGEAIRNLDAVGRGRYIMIRAMSQKVSHLFTDGFFDFIHIDGAHRYEWVKQDIELYWNKCRSGGCFTGHDYSDKFRHRNSVKKAVDEFVEENELELHITKERKFPSWMIMKK